MRRLMSFAVMVMLAVPALAGEREVAIDGGRAPLYGTLSMPDGAVNAPAVLLLAGSGPTDRNGNSSVPGVMPATLKLMADGLAANGIASLRVDKRGIAASAPAMSAEKDLSFDTYVDDAVAWAKFLKSQPGVGCVFILGHSEGALIGALAAAKSDVCGFISVSGAGMRAGDTILRQFRERGAPPRLQEAAKAIVAQLDAGQMATDVPPELQRIFRPGVQPYLISYFAKDPQAAIAALTVPVLILQGTTDVQVAADDAKRLAAAKPGAKLVWLDGVNHVLKTAPAGFQANLATYGDPALPLAPEVIPALTAFIKAPR